MARTRLHLLVKAVFGIAFLFFRISCHAQNWSHNGQPVSLKRNLQIDWLSTWMSHCQAISILKKKEKSMFNIFQYDQPYSKFAQMIPNQSLLSWRFYDILRLLNQHYSYLRAWGSMLSYKQHICKCLHEHKLWIHKYTQEKSLYRRSSTAWKPPLRKKHLSHYWLNIMQLWKQITARFYNMG